MNEQNSDNIGLQKNDIKMLHGLFLDIQGGGCNLLADILQPLIGSPNLF